MLKQIFMGFNFSFFGESEHRVFNYRPRYYDEEKEALKEKFGEVDGSREQEKSAYVPGSYIKGSMRGGNYKKTKGSNKAQKIIALVGLLLFFVVLVLMVKFFALL